MAKQATFIKHTQLIYLALIFIISCTNQDENINEESNNDNHALIGDWQGFSNLHVGGGHYKMMYLIRDLRITKDSIYELKYPTTFVSRYKLNLHNDSISLVKNGTTINYLWSVEDSILILIGENLEKDSKFDTITFFRSEFHEPYFKKIIELKTNTQILEKFSWYFDYRNTSQLGWKNMDTAIYNPHKVIDFKAGNYKLQEGSELIYELDTFRIVRFHKSFFVSDTDRYLLQLEKIIEGRTAILSYRTSFK